MKTHGRESRKNSGFSIDTRKVQAIDTDPVSILYIVIIISVTLKAAVTKFHFFGAFLLLQICKCQTDTYAYLLEYFVQLFIFSTPLYFYIVILFIYHFIPFQNTFGFCTNYFLLLHSDMKNEHGMLFGSLAALFARTSCSKEL